MAEPGAGTAVVDGRARLHRTNRIALAVAPSDPRSSTRSAAASSRHRGARSRARRRRASAAGATNAAACRAGRSADTNMPTNLAGEAGPSQSYDGHGRRGGPAGRRRDLDGRLGHAAEPGRPWNAAAVPRPGRRGAAAGTWAFGFLSGHNAEPPPPIRAGWARGAHPDVHAIEFSGPAATSTVWVGCDGGIFQAAVVPPPARPPAGWPGTPRSALGRRATTAWPSPSRTSWPRRRCPIPSCWPARRTTAPRSTPAPPCGRSSARRRRRLRDRPRPPEPAVRPVHRLHLVHRDRPRPRTTPRRSTTAAPARSRCWRLGDRGQGLAFYSQAGGAALAAAPPRWRSAATGCGTARTGARAWVREPSSQTAGGRCRQARNPYEEKDATGARAGPEPGLADSQGRPGRVRRRQPAAGARPGLDPYRGQPARRPRSTCSPGRARPWTLTWLSPPDPSQPAPPDPPQGAQQLPESGDPARPRRRRRRARPPTCYVTLGVGQDRRPGIDHVWWYDGAHWWPCGFDATVADTPVNAVVVDADRTVYVGTDVGVWKGVPDTGGARRPGHGPSSPHGLPEAPVAWTSCSSRAPHLLRAATHGRGVWELNLDETAPVTQTYLRAHPADTRRVFPAGRHDRRVAVRPAAAPGSTPARTSSSPAPPTRPRPPTCRCSSRPAQAVHDSVRVLQYALRRRQTAQPRGATPAGAPCPLAGRRRHLRRRDQDRRSRPSRRNTAGLTQTGKVTAQDWQAIVTTRTSTRSPAPTPPSWTWRCWTGSTRWTGRPAARRSSRPADQHRGLRAGQRPRLAAPPGGKRACRAARHAQLRRHARRPARAAADWVAQFRPR